MTPPDRFTVFSPSAERVWLCLFDGEGGRETDRIPMTPDGQGWWAADAAGIEAGRRYGLRADGPYDPANGFWFDPDRLLMDPHAVEIDRPYRYDARLAAGRGEAGDTSPLMPKAIVSRLKEVARRPPVFAPGGLVYELNVRSFTMRHPDVPKARRGTIAALAHPAVLGHLERLGVAAVELMPVTAWIDERHLSPLGLSNAWGYNPVTFMALDPRLAPGGVAELRDTVAALHGAGIGVILDLVFNHTGESDVLGPTLSLRGLDARGYYRHGPDGALVNDTGCGNTIACDRPIVRRMILDTLRHFVGHAGIDGFRFDLAPVLARTDAGFDADAAIFAEIAADPLLGDRIMIAEPWDIGPGGYRLGQFPGDWLEWNDRYRDDMRRFWRGDRGMAGALATRLAGSSEIFAGRTTRSVNFLAAHDGMTLADVTAYEQKHNEANGEENRDGHDENLSWNHGTEGSSDDPAIAGARRRDVVAMLATLMLSRGTPMLTAGDEFGRSQDGNNNAYAQDNDVTWLDWDDRDRAIEAAAMALGRIRREFPVLAGQAFLDGNGDVQWLRADGEAMTERDWHDPERRSMAMVLSTGDGGRLAAIFNAAAEAVDWRLPQRDGRAWSTFFDSAAALDEFPPLRRATHDTSPPDGGRGYGGRDADIHAAGSRSGGDAAVAPFVVAPRAVSILVEREVNAKMGEAR
jgi:glycogen debranching enzyme